MKAWRPLPARPSLAAGEFAWSGAVAQSTYPEKPIRIVAAFAADGASDIVARVISEPLGKALGQTVIVDDKPGTGGKIGGLDVVCAPAGGCTVMLSDSAPRPIGPYTVPELPCGPDVQFTHVALLALAPV